MHRHFRCREQNSPVRLIGLSVVQKGCEMARDVWDNLLEELRRAFEQNDALRGFSTFPDDVVAQDVASFQVPCADVMARESKLISKTYSGLRDAILAAGPYAMWRETYKGTDIGQAFLDRFGCYAIIGTGGAFMSEKLWAFIVHMPKGLYYPHHHHPAEEMYCVLAGEAEFMREGEANEILREGDTSFHASNQPHAMETHDKPVLCLVVWRNGFETPPVLTAD